MSRDLFKDFFRSSRDMLCIVDRDGRFERVNAAFEDTLGWPTDALLGRSLVDFVHPEDAGATVRELEALAAGESVKSFEHRYRCADGAYKYLQWTGTVHRKTGVMFGIARDVTPVHEDTARLRVAIDASPAAIIMVDSEGSIRLINKEAGRLFGYTNEEELLGRPVSMLVPPRYRNGHEDQVYDYFNNPRVRPMGIGTRLASVRKDGSEFEAEIALNPIDLANGKHVLVSIVDLTVQRSLEHELREAAEGLEEANARLTELARTDELTGLLNRRGMDEQLLVHVRLMQRLSNPLSFLLIDFDKFKELNDTQGHAAGDKALQALADAMTTCSRASDIAVRLGGDEFAMILPNTDVEGALILGRKIQRQIRDHPWEHSRCTISVGASTWLFRPGKLEPEAEVISSLMEDADRALYRSKHLGGNRATHIANCDEAVVQEQTVPD